MIHNSLNNLSLHFRWPVSFVIAVTLRADRSMNPLSGVENGAVTDIDNLYQPLLLLFYLSATFF